MATYLIRRHEDGKFVSLPGSEHSYTKNLKHARKFPTREAAVADGLCGNESVITLEQAVEAD